MVRNLFSMHLLEVPSGLHVHVPSGVTCCPCSLGLQHCGGGTATSLTSLLAPPDLVLLFGVLLPGLRFFL